MISFAIIVGPSEISMLGISHRRDDCSDQVVDSKLFIFCFMFYDFLKDKILDTDCGDDPLKGIDITKFNVEKKEAESKVVVTTVEEIPIPTTHPYKIALSNSKGVELDSKVLVATADKCEYIWELLPYETYLRGSKIWGSK